MNWTPVEANKNPTDFLAPAVMNLYNTPTPLLSTPKWHFSWTFDQVGKNTSFSIKFYFNYKASFSVLKIQIILQIEKV